MLHMLFIYVPQGTFHSIFKKLVEQDAGVNRPWHHFITLQETLQETSLA